MFVAHEVAMQLIAAVRPIAEAVDRRDRDLARQLRRAATGAANNTSEGGRRTGGDRLHAFRIAAAEAAELATAVRIAVAWGYVAEATTLPALALEDRLQALLWRLRTPRR